MEDEKEDNPPSSLSSKPSLRWGILRKAFLSGNNSSHTDSTTTSEMGEKLKLISRKTGQGFNLIKSQIINNNKITSTLEEPHLDDKSNDIYVSYTLPLDTAPTLIMSQRVENNVSLNDFEICNKYNIDNTGLVCNWPSEDVLAYFCLSHADKFRSKRIIELGAGYGLAGLVIAAATDASEVVISDGNPQVVNYIQRNINANSAAFADTKVKSMILHWNQEQVPEVLDTFDIIVASDCTFFKEFHEGLAKTVRALLRSSKDSEAIFLSPKRGNSLDKFLEKVNEIGMHYSITENYDNEVWQHHQKFLHGDDSWPNYEKDHSYPVLVRITF
ncbi:calmodulin-lysine N-methyltransferase-like isoform X2 [Papaver somniferum]|uniref:calmodulin-lysine N-methyltransferase-like isoform X2 n=1 Tax=Papaver somniferum TaxID=3469 RepID=UPI000E6F77BD|nr:calmodulin-lysine N-methyltransferase-like isoform X2 [Papaver somniferum]